MTQSEPMPETPTLSRAAPAVSVWRYARAVIPAVLLWGGLVAGAAFLLYDRSRWSEKYDRAALREWLEERRPNRKNLGELLDEFLREPTDAKKREIGDQLDAMTEPILMFRAGTPLFLDLFTIRITFPDRSDLTAMEWQSPDRPLRTQEAGHVRSEPILNYRAKDGTRIVVVCEYRMHAFHKAQQEEAARQRWVLAVAGVAVGGSLVAIVWVYLFLRRERRRELAELETNQVLEHTENLRLAEQLRAQTAERSKEDLARHLLEQRLESVRQEGRASEAEKAALQMKSQLYASIGIMAGSYAHNIKNLLVRPNDLLARCIEMDGLVDGQATMLQEVRSTLGTVTERLQQILRTVRRDPSKTEMTRINLNDLIQEMTKAWAEMALDKWKMTVRATPASEPLWISGDLSHLQQTIENLVFNARDATFERRNHLREMARAITEPSQRRQALLEAAAWRGDAMLRTYRDSTEAVLEVRDNGIGMSEEVRQRCLQTHFSTKRDNALYEGYSAGMGLGLSFVVVVLEHHRANLEVESEPEKGATFRLRFPLAE